MENQFFTWKGWDQHDTMVFGFTRCVVTKAFGPFAVGAELTTVAIDYGEGKIEVWAGSEWTDKPTWTGKLTLVIEAAT